MFWFSLWIPLLPPAPRLWRVELLTAAPWEVHRISSNGYPPFWSLWVSGHSEGGRNSTLLVLKFERREVAKGSTFCLIGQLTDVCLLTFARHYTRHCHSMYGPVVDAESGASLAAWQAPQLVEWPTQLYFNLYGPYKTDRPW